MVNGACFTVSHRGNLSHFLHQGVFGYCLFLLQWFIALRSSGIFTLQADGIENIRSAAGRGGGLRVAHQSSPMRGDPCQQGKEDGCGEENERQISRHTEKQKDRVQKLFNQRVRENKDQLRNSCKQRNGDKNGQNDAQPLRNDIKDDAEEVTRIGQSK